MRPLRIVGAAFAFQLRWVRRAPGDLIVLLTSPFYTLVFLSVVQHAGRDDLSGYAVLAPAVMALWHMAVVVSGEIVERDRAGGVLELLATTPAPLLALLSGRVLAVTALSSVALLESWLVAVTCFGVVLRVEHPAEFAATAAVALLATAGWATALSATFVLARSARVFQNALTFPVYVLGGVLVPVALLPGWVRLPAHGVYLSWASDLLRATTVPEPVADFGGRLLAVAVLGAAGYAAGALILRAVLARLRRTGELALL